MDFIDKDAMLTSVRRGMIVHHVVVLVMNPELEMIFEEMRGSNETGQKQTPNVNGVEFGITEKRAR